MRREDRRIEGRREGREGGREEWELGGLLSCTNKHRSKRWACLCCWVEAGGWRRRRPTEDLYSAVDQNDSSRPTPVTRSQQEEREAGHRSNIALASWLPRLGRCYLEGSSRIWISWVVTRRTGGSPTCDEGRAQWRQGLQKSWNLWVEVDRARSLQETSHGPGRGAGQWGNVRPAFLINSKLLNFLYLLFSQKDQQLSTKWLGKICFLIEKWLFKNYDFVLSQGTWRQQPNMKEIF